VVGGVAVGVRLHGEKGRGEYGITGWMSERDERDERVGDGEMGDERWREVEVTRAFARKVMTPMTIEADLPPPSQTSTPRSGPNHQSSLGRYHPQPHTSVAISK
jgi:hypothetical protein